MYSKDLCNDRVFKLAILSVFAIGLSLLTALYPLTALADNEESSTPPETNTAEQTDSTTIATPLGGLPLMGNDYVWFGRDLELSKATVSNDIIAAGQVVNLSECTASGSIRAAAQDIVISNSTASENITVAAQNVTLQNTNAHAIAAAGSTITMSGSCKELTAYAEKVFIDGTVEGDVIVGANSVEIGTNARIKGTLHVDAASDPVMQRGAEVADVEFTKVEASSTSDISSRLEKVGGRMRIALAVVGFICTIIIAVLAEWLFRRHTEAAANMIRTRTGATIGTGIIGALVAPIAIIILMCLVLTLPVAAALALALVAMTCVAGGFAGASLFKLVFPKLGRFTCALAGGAIVGVLSAIPILGGIVDAAAFMYLLGYVLQSIFLGMQNPTRVNPIGPAPSGYPPAPGTPINQAQVGVPGPAPVNPNFSQPN